MKTSEQLDKVLPAIMAVKNKLQAVTKSANNPFFKSKYADLNTYLDEVEPLLEANELVLLQPVTVIETANIVSSIIMHKSGQFISSEMSVINAPDMQKLGSAITYARRYTLGALLSMKAEDDDGNGAVGKTPAAKTTTTKAATLVQTTTETKVTASTTPTVAASVIPQPSTILAGNTDRPSFRKPAATKAATPAPAPVAATSNGDDL